MDENENFAPKKQRMPRVERILQGKECLVRKPRILGVQEKAKAQL